MRRLRNEEGFSLVLVAILLMVLLAFAGFAVDVGAMYQERRELRSGADAAALAIAEDCALHAGSCTSTARTETAEDYADFNADDLHSGVDLVEMDSSPDNPLYDLTVRIVTSSEDRDGNPEFGISFMWVFEIYSTTVRASATAAAGPVGEGETPPLIFEACEWARAFPEYPNPPTSYPSNDKALFLHRSPLNEALDPCPTYLDPAGKDAPGAFGYVGGDDGCSVQIISGIALTSTGNTPPQPYCKPEVIYQTLFGADPDGDGYGEPIPVPIYDYLCDGSKYDDARCSGASSGSGVTYHVHGLGMFETKSYNLGGPYVYPPGWKCPDDPDTPQLDKNATCVFGRFTQATLRSLGEFGGADYGAILVRLID